MSQGFSPGKASRAGSCNSGIVINHGTTFNASGFITPACPSPTTVRATMTSTLTSPSSVGSPTGGGVLCVTSADSASPNQQQQQQRPMLLVRQPSPPSLGEVSENYGLGRTRAGTGVMVSTLGKKAGGLDEGERSLARFSLHLFFLSGVLVNFFVVFFCLNRYSSKSLIQAPNFDPISHAYLNPLVHQKSVQLVQEHCPRYRDINAPSGELLL